MRTRPQYLIPNIRGLVFVYALLCALTVLFTRSFFWETLYEGRVPDTLSLVVFFTIPVALLGFLGIAAASLLGDIAARRPGIKFRARLVGYFLLTVFFSAAPLTIVTSISISEVVRFWHSFDADAARDASRSFAVEAFSFHMERFERIGRETDWEALMAPARAWATAETAPQGSEPQGSAQDGAAPHGSAQDGAALPGAAPMVLAPDLPRPLPEALPAGIAAAQDFELAAGGWHSSGFLGRDEAAWLAAPPSAAAGFPVRELPRDAGFIRSVSLPGPGRARVLSYALGPGFDSGLAAIELQARRFEVIGVLRQNVRILEFFYYAVFFFPPLLMTMIIAISFTRRVTSPIAELTEATRRVAEGDFSVQILSRRGDELGLLVRSFNAMVQDLEKSRAALLKAEKISIWQNMAQQLAHEIKNPLTPIKLSAERVLRRWRNEPGRVGEIVEDSMMAIVQETEGLAALLNEFRTLSKPMEPSRSSIRFGEAAREAVAAYQSSHPGVAFDLSRADGDLSVKIGKSHFSRILANLIINAIDAMGGSGSIEIRAEPVKKKGARFCRISVKDSGRGISPQDAAHVFTPYFTTKESGTGLGLPIVERIVSDHGGSIWLSSAEGAGAVFFIDLPAAEGGGEEG